MTTHTHKWVAAITGDPESVEWCEDCQTVREHKHKWQYAGMCDGEEVEYKCGRRTYSCACGAYKDCDGGVTEA